MGALGIIAEYNPFHKGHLYQLETAKKRSGADAVIVVMSGNYTQRGLPAITDKYTRTRMALEAGADVVLELPVYFATHSAGKFAEAGIAALAATGVVDKLSFGCEAAAIPYLDVLASLIYERGRELETAVTALLKQGCSYPAARAEVLFSWLSKMQGPADAHAFAELISAPNTILALEYLCAMKKLGWHPGIYPIARKGDGYHDCIHQDEYARPALSASFASASGIRENIYKNAQNNFLNCRQNNNQNFAPKGGALHSIQNHVPDFVFSLLQETENKNFPVFADDFSDVLYYAVLQKSMASKKEAAERLCRFEGVTLQLASRILGMLDSYTEFSEFSNKIQSKNFTQGHINRALLHIMLGIRKKEALQENTFCGSPPYLRVLGLKKSSSFLLQHTALPVINKMADAEKVLSEFYENLPSPGKTAAAAMLFEDIHACEIYNRILYRKFGTVPLGEYRQGVVIQ